MRIELYTFTFDDQLLIPFFLDRYSFVDRMTFIDSGSKDDTLDLLKDHNIVKTKLKKYDVPALTKIKNTIWKGSEYDLIIFPDIDEILYRENIREFLECNKYDLYQAEGYEMVSDKFDLSTKKGVTSAWYNKILIFNPKVSIQFAEGSHSVSSDSRNICTYGIKLLHYKYLGLEYLLSRRQKTVDRNPAMYVKSVDQLENELNEMNKNAITVI